MRNEFFRVSGSYVGIMFSGFSFRGFTRRDVRENLRRFSIVDWG